MENKVNFDVKKLLNCHVISAESLKSQVFPKWRENFRNQVKKWPKKIFNKWTKSKPYFFLKWSSWYCRKKNVVLADQTEKRHEKIESQMDNNAQFF